MEYWLALHLHHADTDDHRETVDVVVDYDDHRVLYPLLRRHFVHMAARAADERIRVDVDEMRFLHDWVLVVTEGANHNAVLMRFREG